MSEDAPTEITSEEGNQVPVRYDGDYPTYTDAEGKQLATGENIAPGSPLVGENYEHNPQKAHVMALAEHPAQLNAARERRYAAQSEEQASRQAEFYREKENQQLAEGDKASQRAAQLYDLREFLKNERPTEQQLPAEAAQLHNQILDEASKAYEELDKGGFTGYITTLHAIEELLQLGDRHMLLDAIDIVENPKSEKFTDSYGRGEQAKNLAYRDLAIAAYEGGLVEEAKRIEQLITFEHTDSSLSFAKAWALDSAVPELLEKVGTGAPHIDSEYFHFASHLIADGKFDVARTVAEKFNGVLNRELKYKILARLVEAGDKDSIEAARQAAADLPKEPGRQKEDHEVRALLRLYRAGDDLSLSAALEVVRNYEYVAGRLKLLRWIDAAVKQRAEETPEPPQTEQLAA
ncbi:hypothetical protein BVY00_00020 [bacterium G20]|nr:hypothetical protein BVY00_00020 [bacterium G20]